MTSLFGLSYTRPRQFFSRAKLGFQSSKFLLSYFFTFYHKLTTLNSFGKIIFDHFWARR